MKEFEKILKGKDTSLIITIELIHAIIFPVTMFWCEGWTTKQADRKKVLIPLKCGVGEFYGHRGLPKRQIKGF